jgi:anti-sigma factor RsiW
MRCDDIRIQVSAALDGELDAARAVALHDHLETCASCRSYDQAQRVLSGVLRTTLVAEEPPAGFAARMRAAAITAPVPLRRWRALPRAAKFSALAASWLVAAWLGSWMAQPLDPATDQLVTAHVRSLQLDHLVDVPSSDRHQVKPWFAGKIGITPPVVEVDGFTLVGGRLDWLDGRPAAAIVYRRRAHTINLFAEAAPGPETAPMRVTQKGGWSIVRWRADGVGLALISDLNVNELVDFAHALGAK